MSLTDISSTPTTSARSAWPRTSAAGPSTTTCAASASGHRPVSPSPTRPSGRCRTGPTGRTPRCPRWPWARVAVTPLQLAAAYSAIANGGEWVTPTLVKATMDAEGRQRPLAPGSRTRIIQPSTATQLRDMLTSVVQNGTGKAAAVAGYQVRRQDGDGLEARGRELRGRRQPGLRGLVRGDGPGSGSAAGGRRDDRRAGWRLLQRRPCRRLRSRRSRSRRWRRSTSPQPVGATRSRPRPANPRPTRSGRSRRWRPPRRPRPPLRHRPLTVTCGRATCGRAGRLRPRPGRGRRRWWFRRPARRHRRPGNG